MPDLPTLIEFGKTFGFPALVTAAVLWMVWRAGSWAARNLLLPGFKLVSELLLKGFDRLMRHFDAVEGILMRADQRGERIEAALPHTCRHPGPPATIEVEFGAPAAARREEPPAALERAVPA